MLHRFPLPRFSLLTLMVFTGIVCIATRFVSEWHRQTRIQAAISALEAETFRVQRGVDDDNRPTPHFIFLTKEPACFPAYERVSDERRIATIQPVFFLPTVSKSRRLPMDTLFGRTTTPPTKIHPDIFNHICTLRSVHTIHLRDCCLPAGSVTALQTLPNLREWVVQAESWNDDGADELAGCTSVERLVVIGEHLRPRNLKCLANLPKLNALALNVRSLRNDKLKELFRIPNLRELDISGTQIDSAGLTGISQCGKLEFLDVSRISGIQDFSELAQLRSLVAINLDDSAIDSRAFFALTVLPNLKYVNVRRTQVYFAAVLQFQNARPDVHIDHSEPNRYSLP